MKSKKGLPLMVLGLLLMAAALSLAGYNVWDERRASDAVVVTLDELEPRIQETAPMPEGMIPDHLLSPRMDMPTMEIGGWDLSLFTCTLGGQFRVTVRCERAETAV